MRFAPASPKMMDSYGWVVTNESVERLAFDAHQVGKPPLRGAEYVQQNKLASVELGCVRVPL